MTQELLLLLRTKAFDWRHWHHLYEKRHCYKAAVIFATPLEHASALRINPAVQAYVNTSKYSWVNEVHTAWLLQLCTSVTSCPAKSSCPFSAHRSVKILPCAEDLSNLRIVGFYGLASWPPCFLKQCIHSNQSLTWLCKIGTGLSAKNMKAALHREWQNTLLPILIVYHLHLYVILTYSGCVDGIHMTYICPEHMQEILWLLRYLTLNNPT